jgi:hypothetical protein
MKPRIHANIAVGLIWLGGIVSLMGNSVDRRLLWAGLAVCIAGIAYRMIMVRCPFCGRTIDGFQSLPKNCPHCGETLD